MGEKKVGTRMKEFLATILGLNRALKPPYETMMSRPTLMPITTGNTTFAPQETIVDVMLDMLFDSGGTVTKGSGWMEACKHYYGRLSVAREPTLPKLGITNVPDGGIVVLIPTEDITTLQFREIRHLIQHEAKGGIKFIMLPPKMKIQTLSDDDLSRLGLQRVPAT